ncbi:MAG: phage protease [Bacteroidota bacterium]
MSQSRMFFAMQEAGALLASGVSLNGQAPSEFLLMPIGEWHGFRNIGTYKEPRTIRNTPEKLKAAVEYHSRIKQRNPNKKLPIDYEHQSITGEIAPAAGWFGGLELRADGVYATGVEWTPRGKKFIEEKEYMYLSPWWHDQDVIGKPYTDKGTGEKVAIAVFGAGLTNNPFFDELPALVSKDGSHNLYIVSSNNFKEDTMDLLTQFLIGFLALGATATPEQMAASAKSFRDQFVALGFTGTDLTAKGIVDQVTAKLTALKTATDNYSLVAKALGAAESDPVEKLTALIASAKDKTGFVAQAEFETLKAGLVERDVKEFLAASGNKITKATYDQFLALGKKDFSALKELVAKMPVLVNMETIALNGNPRAEGEDVSEADVLVAKQMGVDVKLLATKKN